MNEMSPEKAKLILDLAVVTNKEKKDQMPFHAVTTEEILINPNDPLGNMFIKTGPSEAKIVIVGENGYQISKEVIYIDPQSTVKILSKIRN